MFTKTSNKQTTQIKKKTATRKAKTEAKQTEEQNEEPLGERDRQEMMVQWAVSGFKPSGPKGFAPTDGIHMYIVALAKNNKLQSAYTLRFTVVQFHQ